MPSKSKPLFCGINAAGKPTTYVVHTALPSTKRIQWRLPWVMDMAGDTVASRMMNVIIIIHIVSIFLAEKYFVNDIVCGAVTDYSMYPTACAGWNTTIFYSEQYMQNLQYPLPGENAAVGYALDLGYWILDFLQTYLIYLPCFIVNSYSDRIWMVACALAYSVFLIIFRLLLADVPLASYFQDLVNFWQASPRTEIYVPVVLAAVFVFFAIITLFVITIGWSIVLYLVIKKVPFYLYVQRLASYRQHVSLLLDPKYQRDKLKKQFELRNKAKALMDLERSMTEGQEWRHKFVRKFKHTFGCGEHEPNWHEPFETKSSFFYPQRLFFALAFSTAEILLVIGLLVRVVPQIIAWLHNTFDFLSEVLTFLGYPGLGRLNDTLDKTIRATFYSCMAAYSVIYVIQWILIYKNYKVRMFEVRQGKFKGDRTNFSLFRMVEYILIQGLCFLAFFIGFAAICVGIAAGGLISYYVDRARQEMIELILRVALNLAILVIPIRVGEIVFFRYMCSSPSGFYPRNRRLLAAGELVSLFVFIPFAFFQVILRLIFSTFFQLFTLPLLHHSTISRNFEAWDPGVRCYQAMLFADHLTNNPIINVFVAHLYRPIVTQRHIVEKAWMSENIPPVLRAALAPPSAVGLGGGGGPQSDAYHAMTDKPEVARIAEMQRVGGELRPVNERVRKRWLLAYTLIKNPLLRVDRRHQFYVEKAEDANRYATRRALYNPKRRQPGLQAGPATAESTVNAPLLASRFDDGDEVILPEDQLQQQRSASGYVPPSDLQLSDDERL
eukprot:TRINITY_DN4350_c0_g1_i12.p1 TRINITY_DN4350_c0_g1~~TRINITY_DN4350_c0_g1_i12.p1  ORF type:complete len:780 (+),score=171.80 TRINITY_DN4350_c0_g1_i12:65-2404(+)